MADCSARQVDAAIHRQRGAHHIVARLAGQVDGCGSHVVVGTHAVLSDQVGFKDLGLVIVDEEQHFGVKHKEKLKSLRADVHLLTLSATPIPRTLQMALSGIREMSIIATPPVDRLAVRTYVTPWDPVLVREARDRAVMLHARAMQLLCHVARGLPDTVAPTSIDKHMERFDAEIRTHLRDHWTLKDYSAALMITPTHLNRITRQSVGLSAARYIEARLFHEHEVPWDELAFRTVRETLRHFFDCRRSGSFTLHCGTL